MNAKVKVARLSLLSNTSLIIMKLIVGLFTGSVSIISEAIHSTMDLLAAIIAFFCVRISDKPADDTHPYGHGKVENISGVIEALLIFIASVLIIIEAVKKIINPSEIESVGVGFIVMFISAAVNFVVSKKIYKVAKQEDSIALEADALHLKADVYTSLGVGSGLLLIWVTGLNYLDPIVAILVAIFILKEALELLKAAFNPLLDVKLSDGEIEIIKDTINKYASVFCNYHDLKTRKSGRIKYIDLHLVFPENKSIKEAHDICDKIEANIEEALKYAEVMIHLESSEKECNCLQCKSQCTLKIDTIN
ncbi:cation transporter [Clostridium gelidum]|uniref:Cation transporter n=1 Tax=Clostridium gelidum TaxID=704125 RepID=A0ABN6IX32_9CLOT|nr:cation diffusion facilitator family transporter [Clostridium gelidum]BCZ45993.1 cation transporter [Clostridium gelidum]